MIADGGPYGSREDMEDIQSSAPMQGGGQALPPAPTPPPAMGAPTANPNEPVTAGSPLGPGIGPLAAGIQSDQQQTISQMAPLLNSLELIANLPGSNAETRAFVRNLKANAAQ